MIRDGDAKLILQHSQHLDDVARTVAERARCLECARVRRKVRSSRPRSTARSGACSTTGSSYAEELHQDQVDLNYTADGPSTTRKLLHEMLDPKLVNLSPRAGSSSRPRDR